MRKQSKLVSAAERVTLAIGADPYTKALGFFTPVLQEEKTLRRVALFYKGTGRYTMTPDERFSALDVIRCRFDERFHGNATDW